MVVAAGGYRRLFVRVKAKVKKHSGTSRGLSDAQVQLISGRLLHQFILALFAATR
jgi:hypothetical protein